MNLMENSQSQKQIAVFLAAYNGQDFLLKQLDSIAKQTHKQLHLYVIDDGSTDQSYSILKEYQQHIGAEKMTVIKTINQGCAQAILTLVCDASIQADYYAYADHDDIWDLDKLEIAINSLEKLNNEKPLLYCSSARLIDAQDKEIGRLPISKKQGDFKHSVVKNIAAGNTMVFNQAACDVLRAAGKVNISIPDWWTYLVVAACGQVFYDPNPRLFYRLHSHNMIGFDSPLRKRYKSIKHLLNGGYQNCIIENLNALHTVYDKLSPSSKEVLNYYDKSRHGNIVSRLYNLHKSGLCWQGVFGTFCLFYIACLPEKV